MITATITVNITAYSTIIWPFLRLISSPFLTTHITMTGGVGAGGDFIFALVFSSS